MAKIDLTSAEWCELVFQGKNKEFGAYKLRMESPRRHNRAMLVILAAVAAAVALPFLIESILPERLEKEVMTEVTTLSNLSDTDMKDEPQVIKPDLPPPPPLKSSVKFTPPVIVEDKEVTLADEMKTQDELKEMKEAISVADVVGTDEVNGKDIAELQTIAAEQTADDETIYQTVAVEQKPQYPGGLKALYEYLRLNTNYPEFAADNNVQGKVILQFAVMKDGSISNITVIRAIDSALDKEAVRVVSAMPKWIPGKQNGRPVNVYYMLPVIFRLH